jgi:cellulose synthase/poly-beta-1,6-N-acetylglucosamine synthase-like glycosyltransferase
VALLSVLLAVFTAFSALSVLQALILLVAAGREAPPVRPGPRRSVSVIVPSFNEERVLDRTLTSVFRSEGVDLVEVVCVDDGSTDGTPEVLRSARDRYGDRLVVVRQPNRGKASALNAGLARIRTPHFVTIDADTQVLPHTLALLLRHFSTGRVAAVSGQMLVGNSRPHSRTVFAAQTREYEYANNIVRRAFARVDAITVVPGAIGAFDTAAVSRAGGYPEGTLAEDAHLTAVLLGSGHRIRHEPRAVVVTEAPDALRGLLRQRTRWSTGKIQVMLRTRRAAWRGPASGRLTWWYSALSETLLPLLTPVISVGLPVCLISLASADIRSPLVAVAVAVALVQLLVLRRTSRSAHLKDAPARALTGLPPASPSPASYLVIPMVRFVATAASWYAVLTRRRNRWNKLARTGDVGLPPESGPEPSELLTLDQVGGTLNIPTGTLRRRPGNSEDLR